MVRKCKRIVLNGLTQYLIKGKYRLDLSLADAEENLMPFRSIQTRAFFPRGPSETEPARLITGRPKLQKPERPKEVQEEVNATSL